MSLCSNTHDLHTGRGVGGNCRKNPHLERAGIFDELLAFPHNICSLGKFSVITFPSTPGVPGMRATQRFSHRYVDEQVFRFNNRKNKTDADRFNKALSQIAGKRLTFAEVTGKVGETEEF